MPGKHLSEEERKRLVHDLISRSVVVSDEHKLPAGTKSAVAQKFSCSVRQVERIWSIAQQKHAVTGVWSATPQRKGRCGRKRVYEDDSLMEGVKAVPANDRGMMRAVAKVVGISAATVCRKKKEGIILAHTNSIKPLLTEQNKLTRLLYALDRVQLIPTGAGLPPRYVFRAGYDEVHIDEKWFYITQINKRFYLAHDEPPPKRGCKHKSHITKVMFLCAVARPRFAGDMCTFDGKIGIWPFVTVVRAQNNSVNRPAGTLETKTVTCDKATYAAMLIEEVLPAIRAKWPAEDGDCEVRLQEDNAKPHNKSNNIEWHLLCVDPGERVKLKEVEQPSNSPDTNVDDLGFFRSLQSDYWTQTPSTTIDGLINNVKQAFADYDPKKLNRIWLTHGTVLNCIIEHEGDNHYKIPHMGKLKLEREGRLPDQISLSSQAIRHYRIYTSGNAGE
jgi:hypothetical protein